MTASPGLSYTNDVLGNRLTKGSTSYSWDILNRMTGTGSTSYAYRADGMRVSKSSSSGSTKYRYDGQMGTEDVELNSGGSVTAITRHGLGARGVDVVSRTTSSGNTLTYPLYDAHGNGVGQLARNGASFTVSDERTYDAWGGVRSGGTSDNNGRYVANLGHKQDDESGLIYMRARYYEPTTGRFVSQDRACDGANWYLYCDNSPLNKIDADGNESFYASLIQLVVGLLKDFGFKNLAVAAWDLTAEALAEKLKSVARSLMQRALVHNAEAIALSGRQDWFGKAAAGAAGRLAAREFAAGVTLMSVSTFLRWSDELADDVGPFLLFP